MSLFPDRLLVAVADHVNVLNCQPTVYNPANPTAGAAGMARNMTGIAMKMSAGGYKTHYFGKWDVGMATLDHTPHGRGYLTGLHYFNHENDYCIATNNLPLLVTAGSAFIRLRVDIHKTLTDCL